jgi:hypothetical protein
MAHLLSQLLGLDAGFLEAEDVGICSREPVPEAITARSADAIDIP